MSVYLHIVSLCLMDRLHSGIDDELGGKGDENHYKFTSNGGW